MAQQLVGRSTHVESSFHQLLKEVASDELEKEGYDLYVEPSEPPEERLAWRFYRPDILGLMHSQTMLSLVFVECETNPRMRRISGKISKIRRSFVAQKRLNEDHLLRLLLVIPPGVLHRVVNSKIRRTCEIWIVNKSGNIIHKIPKSES
jgi:hypothetical protein